MKSININTSYKVFLLCGIFGILCVFNSGCQESKMSTNQEMAAFDLAGPITPKVDLDQLLIAKNTFGIYTVGIDDVLEIQMPTIITAISPKTYNDQLKQIEPYLCRVSDAGTITVPILGEMNVEGKTLAQIEAELVGGYYPKYVVGRPSVVCSVKEYYFKNITVVGAVVQPGVYQLRSNEMSLVTALMKAGGIIEGGASVITIKNPQRTYVSSKPADKSAEKVKQPDELGGGTNEQYIESIEEPAEKTKNIQEPNFSALEVDLVFQPEFSGSTQGNLIIQKGSEILYSKKVEVKNSDQRAEYIKELQTIIGPEQTQMVGKALEQLASQLSPTIAASGEKQTNSEETELVDTADEFSHNRQGGENNTADKKEDCPGCNKKYIEPSSGSKAKIETAEDVNDVKFIEPADNNSPALKTTAVVEPIILPVKGLNIPFADVSLMDGDLIEVKRLNPAVFTVIGLAKTPGAFPYPPDVEYNLMQAIGFAGGVDIMVNPKFITVYRQDAKGSVVSATFRIDKGFMAKMYDVKIKPGDVISVDVTARARMNMLINQMLRINFGLYVNPMQ